MSSDRVLSLVQVQGREAQRDHFITFRMTSAAAAAATLPPLLLQAKIRQGGALVIPVRESTLAAADRATLAELHIAVVVVVEAVVVVGAPAFTYFGKGAANDF